MKSLFESQVLLASKVMDFRLQRQNIVMSNLANIKTPGYRARTLTFEKDLQSAVKASGGGTMSRTHMKHMPASWQPGSVEGDITKEVKPKVVQGEDAVDLDKEMASMAKNTLMYNALATALRKNFEGLKEVIREGSK